MSARRYINLYQAEFRPARVVLPTRLLLTGVALFAAGLLALHGHDTYQLRRFQADVAQLTEQAERAEQQLSRIAQTMQPADPRILAEAAELEARIRALQQAEAMVNSGALGGAHGYAGQFVALARAKVHGAWLTGIDLGEQGRAMSLSGLAVQGDAPATLIAALRQQPQFAGLTYAGLEVQPQKAPGEAEAGAAASAARKSVALEFSLMARLPEPSGAAGTGGKP